MQVSSNMHQPKHLSTLTSLMLVLLLYFGGAPLRDGAAVDGSLTVLEAQRTFSLQHLRADLLVKLCLRNSDSLWYGPIRSANLEAKV